MADFTALSAATSSPALPRTQTLKSDEQLHAAAQDLEAAFLAEMLQHAGFGKARESMGGGIGEEQFSSFLVQEQSKAIAARGGIGLAETIFEAMKKGQTQ